MIVRYRILAQDIGLIIAATHYTAQSYSQPRTESRALHP